jgi:hypothetical protein
MLFLEGLGPGVSQHDSKLGRLQKAIRQKQNQTRFISALTHSSQRQGGAVPPRAT